MITNYQIFLISSYTISAAMMAAVLIMHTVPLIAPLAILMHTTPLMIPSVILAATFLLDVISANVASPEQWELKSRTDSGNSHLDINKNKTLELTYLFSERNSIIGFLFSLQLKRRKEANIYLVTSTTGKTSTTSLHSRVDGKPVTLGYLPKRIREKVIKDISKSAYEDYQEGHDLTPTKARHMVECTSFVAYQPPSQADKDDPLNVTDTADPLDTSGQKLIGI